MGYTNIMMAGCKLTNSLKINVHKFFLNVRRMTT